MFSWRKAGFAVFWVALLVVAAAVPVLAQCPMCKQAVESSTDPEALSKTMNLAVLVLLIPPVAIFAGIFALVYRTRNSYFGDPDADDS
jgi:hypothetical protein